MSRQLKRREERAVNRVVMLGLLIRVAVLLVMLTFFEGENGLYFLEDDIKYEKTAELYLRRASFAIDSSELRIASSGYIQPFWPIAMCISAGIFRTMYAGRFLNILMSAMSAKLIYQIVLIMSENKKSALFAAKLFAFLPVTVLTSCFPIKDIFLTWATLYVFLVFVRIHMGKGSSVASAAACFGCLVGIYNTRGAVAELLLLFFMAILIHRYLALKSYTLAAVIVLITIILLYFFGENVVDALTTKLDDYSGYNTESTGGLSMLQMKAWYEFYKIPFAYVYATFQPMVLNLMGESSGRPWLRVISYMNISIYPVAIANAMYIFQKKHNLLFWAFGTAIYCAIISVSLGIFRHYLFLMPLTIINAALCLERSTTNKKLVMIFGSMGVFTLVILYTLL